MKKSFLVLLYLVCIVSCSKREDLFDKTRVEEESKETFRLKILIRIMIGI